MTASILKQDPNTFRDYPENLQIAFVLINSVLVNLSCVWILYEGVGGCQQDTYRTGFHLKHWHTVEYHHRSDRETGTCDCCRSYTGTCPAVGSGTALRVENKFHIRLGIWHNCCSWLSSGDVTQTLSCKQIPTYSKKIIYRTVSRSLPLAAVNDNSNSPMYLKEPRALNLV